jgi:hypothetical protein
MRDDQIMLYRLGSALAGSFRRLGDAVETGEAPTPAVWWTNFLAGALDRMLLRDPTACEEGQGLFPFARPHEIAVSSFLVPGSGSAGRGQVDVLFQLWLDTETTKCALGTPLLFRTVDGARPVAPDIWDELQGLARPLSEWSPSSRILLCGHPDPFAYPPTSVLANERVYAMPASLCAGYTCPPRGVSGVRADRFGHDLASGWLGDPMLGGANPSHLSSFLNEFQVGRILRVHVTKPT